MKINKRDNSFYVDWREQKPPYRRLRQNLGVIPERLAWSIVNEVYSLHMDRKIDVFETGFKIVDFYYNNKAGNLAKLKDGIAAFLEAKKLILRERSVQGYAELLDFFVRFTGKGDHFLSEIKTADVAPFILRKNLAPKSQDNYKRHLRSFFSWCLEQNMITVNPVDGIKTAKVKKNTVRKMLQGDELERLFAAADNHVLEVDPRRRSVAKAQAEWFKVAISVMIYAGLRRGEVAVLKRKHITEQGILVEAQKGDTDRLIPILPKLAAVLDEWLPKIPKGDEVPLLYVSYKNGRAAEPERIYRVFAEYREKAGLPKERTIHGLRHAFVSSMFSEYGLSTTEVKLLAGHSSVSVTEGYAHLSVASIGQKMFKAK